MLSKRIIPCLDVDRGRVVKGTNFQNLRDAGDPVEVAKRYQDEGADELVFLDISASHEGRQIMAEMVSRVAEVVFMPLTVGGGIRNLDDATALVQAGAEKVSINSSAVKDPDLVNQISKRFGSCATVVNIDPRRTRHGDNIKFEVHIQGGRKPTGLEALRWAAEVAQRGAGEIILTSMDADGTRNGYDIEITKAVAANVRIPVVASGGAGHPTHLAEALTQGMASAVLAASIFHYGEYPIPVVKRFLAGLGIPIRI
ncbi:MAG: imidazole glycerol phosphate synthase subunit HisF [Planctomycetota bacterium]